ncbi:MAG: hypothetical protein QF565_09635, partial [Arenicellales bacterium]|nr:hypothetical protein [Arenicellales bacterium]
DTLPAIHNPATGQRSVRNVLSSAAVLSIILILLNNAGVLEHSHLEGDYNHDDVHVEESL